MKPNYQLNILRPKFESDNALLQNDGISPVNSQVSIVPIFGSVQPHIVNHYFRGNAAKTAHTFTLSREGFQLVAPMVTAKFGEARSTAG